MKRNETVIPWVNEMVKSYSDRITALTLELERMGCGHREPDIRMLVAMSDKYRVMCSEVHKTWMSLVNWEEKIQLANSRRALRSEAADARRESK